MTNTTTRLIATATVPIRGFPGDAARFGLYCIHAAAGSVYQWCREDDCTGMWSPDLSADTLEEAITLFCEAWGISDADIDRAPGEQPLPKPPFPPLGPGHDERCYAPDAADKRTLDWVCDRCGAREDANGLYEALRTMAHHIRAVVNAAQSVGREWRGYDIATEDLADEEIIEALVRITTRVTTPSGT